MGFYAKVKTKNELQHILKFAEKEDFSQNIVKKQLRALWTALCLHENYNCDTHEYDVRLYRVWEIISKNRSNPWLNDEDKGIFGYDLFDDFMCQDIV